MQLREWRCACNWFICLYAPVPGTYLRRRCPKCKEQQVLQIPTRQPTERVLGLPKPS